MQMLGGQREQGGGVSHEGSQQGYERHQGTSEHQLPPAPPSGALLENEKDDLPF